MRGRLLALPAAASGLLLFLLVAPAQAMPAATGSETGPAAPSAQKYRWVDSTAPGCLAPSLITPTSLPAKGCPLGWDEVPLATGPGPSSWIPASDASLSIAIPFSITYFGLTTGSWNINENGFLSFSCSYSGAPTNTGKVMPTAGSTSVCGSAGAPANLVAGFWTNMRGATTCFDTPPGPGIAGRVYYRKYNTGLPTEYEVIQYNRFVVAASDTSPCSIAHKFATFQIKVYRYTNVIDVVYRAVDTNGQQTSFGIENNQGTIGLNYDFASSMVLSDRAVRYYPNHVATAAAGTVNLNEDCAAPPPPASACSATQPLNFGSDIDYADTMTYAVTTSPAKGAMVPAACSAGTCAYAPNVHYNGADSYQYTVTSSDGSTAGPATITLNLGAINDAPYGAPPYAYDVQADDFLYVPAAAGLLAGALDPEVPPLRNTWGPGMADGTPLQSISVVRNAALCGYTGTGWDPANEDPAKPLTVGSDGSFTYTPMPGYGSSSALPPGMPDSFKFCYTDGLLYGPVYTVDLSIGILNGDLVAKSDLFLPPEDATLSVGTATGPAGNDFVCGCASGVSYQLVGPPPANAAFFSGLSPSGGFTYTPLADWFGTDSFQYVITSTDKGNSNVATVVLDVQPVNDAPSYTWYKSGGDSIPEDNGNLGAPPPPYVRSVANFFTGLSVGPPNEAAQTLGIQVVSQSNPGILLAGPTFVVSGGSATLTYTTLPDANGSNDVCVRVTDSGGTALGGIDKEPFPPADPLCFNLQLVPVPDKPRAYPDAFTIFRDHDLVSPDAAKTWPVPKPAVVGITANDVEPDGEPYDVIFIAPYGPNAGKLVKTSPDGSFVYRPKPGYVGLDEFGYVMQDITGAYSKSVNVTITILDNLMPTAEISTGSEAAFVGQGLAFMSVCKDPDGSIVAWLWDFGDGLTATETSPVHTWAAPGTYTVTLYCYDNRGDVAIDMVTVEVGWGQGGPTEEPPIFGSAGLLAYAGENQVVPEGAIVALHGEGQGGMAGAPLAFSWSQVAGPAVALQGADKADARFEAPMADGAGPVAVVLQLRVTDGVATSLPSIVQVTVHSSNSHPQAQLGAAQRVVQGRTATLDGSASSDPDGDVLAYEWRQLSGTPVELAGATSAIATFTVPPYDGTPLVFELKVSDGRAASTAQTQVLALPPDAAAAGFTYDLVRTASGARVTFHAAVPGAQYVWDFGDGVGSSQEADPTYEYRGGGAYTVRLAVLAEGKSTAFERLLVVPGPPADAPVARPVEHQAGAAGAGVAVTLFAAAALRNGAARLRKP